MSKKRRTAKIMRLHVNNRTPHREDALRADIAQKLAWIKAEKRRLAALGVEISDD